MNLDKIIVLEIVKSYFFFVLVEIVLWFIDADERSCKKNAFMNFIDRSVCDLTEVIFPNNLLHLKISGGRRIYVRLPELELPKHIKTLELRSLNALKQIILPGSKYVTS